MFFLRDLIRFADSIGLFKNSEEHQVPSIREWEKKIFETKGKIENSELEKYFH